MNDLEQTQRQREKKTENPAKLPLQDFVMGSSLTDFD